MFGVLYTVNKIVKWEKYEMPYYSTVNLSITFTF